MVRTGQKRRGPIEHCGGPPHNTALERTPMAKLGITAAFGRYGAALRNPQWSVSAWARDGSLVVSLWDHHSRKGPPGTLEFTGSMDRWSGHGNKEFRENIAKAFAARNRVRLVVAKTNETARVEAGEDASTVEKEFFVREDLVGEVVEVKGDQYVFRFRKA